MANEILSAEGLGLIGRDAAYEWKNNNTFLATATRDYDRMYDANAYYNPGETIYVRLPNNYLTQEGDSVTAKDVKEAVTPIVLEPLLSVPLTYTTTDLTTKVGMANWKKRVLYPAMRSLVSQLNLKIALKAESQVSNYVGDETSNINSYADIDNAAASLDELANSRAIKRYASLSVRQSASLRQSATLQNSFVEPLNREITYTSKLGRLADFDMFVDQSIPYHTTYTGDRSGVTVKTTVTTSGTNTIVLTGFTPNDPNVVLVGDVFEIAGVNSVNPITLADTGVTRKWVVTANANADAGGDASVSVEPAIIFDTDNARRNVTAAPAATNVVTFVAAHHVNMAWSEDGLCVVCPKLAPLDSPYSVTVQDPDSGYSLRLSKSAEVLDNQNIFRLDVLWGATWLDDRAVRILSL